MLEQIPLVDAPQNLSHVALIILFEAVSENLVCSISLNIRVQFDGIYRHVFYNSAN